MLKGGQGRLRPDGVVRPGWPLACQMPGRHRHYGNIDGGKFMKNRLLMVGAVGARDRRPVLRPGHGPATSGRGHPGPDRQHPGPAGHARRSSSRWPTRTTTARSRRRRRRTRATCSSAASSSAPTPTATASLSPEEARAAREQLFSQQPLLRYVLQKAKPQNAGDAAGRRREDPDARPGGPDHRRQPGPGDRQPAGHQPRPQDRGHRAAPGGAAGRADPLPGRGRQPGRPAQPGRAESGRRRGGEDGGADRLPDRRHRP